MPAIKLVVTSTGWQHVSQPTLVAAGLDPGINPAQLQLFADGVEQSLSIVGNGDAAFDSGEALEFYGQARDTLWTGGRTYWLVVRAAGRHVPLSVYPASGQPPESFPGLASLRQRSNYFAALKNGEASNFFGDIVGPGGVTESVTVTHLDRHAGGRAAGRLAGGHGWKPPGGDHPRRTAGGNLRVCRTGSRPARFRRSAYARGGMTFSWWGRVILPTVAGGQRGDRLPAPLRRRRQRPHA